MRRSQTITDDLNRPVVELKNKYEWFCFHCEIMIVFVFVGSNIHRHDATAHPHQSRGGCACKKRSHKGSIKAER